MSEEYDVKGEIRIDANAAVGATDRLTQDLLGLQRTLLNTGSVMLSVFQGVRPQLDHFANQTHAAAGHMGLLKTSALAVNTTVTPLARSMQLAAEAVTKFGQQGTRAIPPVTQQVDQLARSGRRAGDSMQSAFQRAGQAAGPLTGILRNTLGLATAYFGIRALGGAFSSMVKSSFALGGTLEQQRTSLGAVLAATQGDLRAMKDRNVAMERGGQLGDAMFRALQADALKSVATSSDLAMIFTSISGPLAGAGAKLGEIRKITNDTVSAATVLGVDLAQASRDINLMATGAAGTDTALFRMLLSTGAIVDDQGKLVKNAQQWNSMLPEKRLRAMQKALAGFGPAASKFEKTFPGISSSFTDFGQRFRQTFMGGPIDAMRLALIKIVGVFNDNESRIGGLLKLMGDKIGAAMTPALNWMISATKYFINNWDLIAARIENGWKTLKAVATQYAPSIIAGAKGAAVASMVGKYAPGALSTVGGGLSAGLAGGAAVEGSGVATAISGLTHLFSVIGAMGGVFTYVILPISILVGLVMALADQWQYTVIVLGVIWGFLQDVFSTIWGLLTALFSALSPLLKIVGIVVAAFAVLVGIFAFFFIRILWGAMKAIIEGWTLIFQYLGEGLDWIYSKISFLFTGLAQLFGAINADLLPKAGAGGNGISWLDDIKGQFAAAMAGFDTQKAKDKALLDAADKNAPATRAGTVVDMRGSKIEVKQDFRQADPDRVWAQFVQGIGDAADQRLSSALVPGYTR